jgi:hypothetical protein
VKPPTQDRRRLRRYARRWLVERFFCLATVATSYPGELGILSPNFLGFVQLACLVILSGDFEIGSNLIEDIRCNGYAGGTTK